jgi:hypothetical protein
VVPKLMGMGMARAQQHTAERKRHQCLQASHSWFWPPLLSELHPVPAAEPPWAAAPW